jgi:micrococcal nuclease
VLPPLSPPPRPSRRRGATRGRAAPRLLAASVALVVLSGCGVARTTSPPIGTTSPGGGPNRTGDGSSAVVEGVIEPNATVTRVVDGDTIHVDRNGREDTIRLIGMDTPETKKPNTAVECFGHEASDHLNGLLPVGTRVRLERDAEERDRYDRVLAYVYREDGVFVNLAMVADGYAGQLTIPPNVAHAAELTEAARLARAQDKGLWSACGGNHVAAR